jgi:catechol 2,3-dioxygenase-like lactoylglutathione lyase family enzyme
VESANVKLSKIAAIMLGVSDLDKSTAFYRDQLGFTLQQHIPYDFSFFDGGGMMLILSLPHSKIHGGAKPGSMEVVFGVADILTAYESLRARGIQFKNEPRAVSGPMWAANFDDPDGHHLSIFGPNKRV